MGKVSTKELFDKYYSTKDQEYVDKYRAKVDRPELYEFEKRIGKEFIDMNIDDIIEMFRFFTSVEAQKFRTGGRSMSYGTCCQLISPYRQIFEFYIDTIELIRNPFNDKRMKGGAGIREIVSNDAVVSKADVDRIIGSIHSDFPEDRACYIECIMLLYYNGFESTEEIVNLKEDMIDFGNNTIYIGGRTIRLSDRCAELLKYVHDLEFMTFKGKGHFEMIQWHDGYFKYSVRAQNVTDFQDRTKNQLCMMINQELITKVSGKYHCKLNYKILYMLGFYDYLVRRYGEEKVKEAVLSSGSPSFLLNASKEYGVSNNTIVTLKTWLLKFVKI